MRIIFRIKRFMKIIIEKAMGNVNKNMDFQGGT